MKLARAILGTSACLLTLTGSFGLTPSLAKADFASLDQPGPALEIPEAQLDAALNCPEDLESATKSPVLLIPGTRLSAEANYGWNWKQALEPSGIPVCTVELGENRGMNDVQETSEYVVHAIRKIHQRPCRKVRIVGFSQGGIVPRWALRFWPDIRHKVSKLVTLAGVHNGTTATIPFCAGGCAPSLQQQQPGTDFTEALNSETTTYPGIKIASLYSELDELATPNANGEASTLEGATNIALQDICSQNAADHLTTGTTDPVAYALGYDALTHGNINTNRLPNNICSQFLLPGVDPTTVPNYIAVIFGEVLDSLINEPKVNEEPALRCYVTGTCGAEQEWYDENAEETSCEAES